MTREEKLYSMTMLNLVEVANKLGVKIDKKGAKSKAVAKILAAENAVAENEKPVAVETVAEPVVDTEQNLTDEQYAEIGKEIAEEAKQKAKAVKKPREKANGVDDETIKKIENAVSDAGFECKSGRSSKDSRVYFIKVYAGKKQISLIYFGIKYTTVFFDNDSVKSLLEDKDFEILDSEEKFAFYVKGIDSDSLVNAVSEFRKEVG